GAEPQTVGNAIPEGLLIFAGGVLQTLFAIAAWPLQRSRPQRLALAEGFRGLAELSERIRLELFALASQQAACEQPEIRAVLASARSAAAKVLTTIADALEQAVPPASTAALEAYAQAIARIESAPASADAEIANARIAALGGQLRAAVRNTDTAGSRGEIRALHSEFRLPRALQSTNPFSTLRANLRLSSPAFRH